LLPHAPSPFAFPPPGNALNPDDAAWFRVQVREQADSGAAQALRFYVQNRQGNSWVEPELELRDSTGGTVVDELDGNPLDDPDSNTSPNGSPMRTIDGRTSQNDHVLMRVQRADMNSPLDVLAGWRTNLILLGGVSIGPTPSALVCVDETKFAGPRPPLRLLTHDRIGEDVIRLTYVPG
jgi:hypothetical protein